MHLCQLLVRRSPTYVASGGTVGGQLSGSLRAASASSAGARDSEAGATSGGTAISRAKRSLRLRRGRGGDLVDATRFRDGRDGSAAHTAECDAVDLRATRPSRLCACVGAGLRFLSRLQHPECRLARSFAPARQAIARRVPRTLACSGRTEGVSTFAGTVRSTDAGCARALRGVSRIGRRTANTVECAMARQSAERRSGHHGNSRDRAGRREGMSLTLVTCEPVTWQVRITDGGDERSERLSSAVPTTRSTARRARNRQASGHASERRAVARHRAALRA